MKSNKLVWIGWVLTVLTAFVFGMGAFMALTHQPAMLKTLPQFGFSESMVTPLGILQLSCLILYLIPSTSVLGAVLLTGYLGGAVCTHWRIGQSFMTPLIVGCLVWGGIYLRESRLHALLPFRTHE